MLRYCRRSNLQTNYKAKISYNGSGYCGFQSQQNGVTIQGKIEQALESLYREEVKIVSAGRTDSGVHAIGQVVSFKVKNKYSPSEMQCALNSLLTKEIRVRDIEEKKMEFNARYSAVSREYKYLFSNVEIPHYLKTNVAKIKFKPKINNISGVHEYMQGPKDFVFFKKKEQKKKSTVRTLTKFEVKMSDINCIYEPSEKCGVYEMNICAESFLYRMVRNLAGAIFEVLKGKRTLEEFERFFVPEKSYSYVTAPAHGLCLVRVNY